MADEANQDPADFFRKHFLTGKSVGSDERYLEVPAGWQGQVLVCDYNTEQVFRFSDILMVSNEGLDILGNLVLNQSSGFANIRSTTGNVNIEGNVLISSKLSVNGNLSIGQTINSGAITSTGLLTGVGLTTTGAITATGQTINSGAITCTGLTTTGAITATNQTINSGAITCTGLTTTGPITATNQTINSGAITCTGLNTTGTIILNPNNDIVNVSTSRITNCIDPTNPQDVATKNYVDTRTPTATLSSTLTAGNSAGSTSINMNSQPITNVSLISPPSTNQRFSVVAIEASEITRNAAYPADTAYNGQMCFLLDSRLMTYFITGSGWQIL
jgi:hypothetical protein